MKSQESQNPESMRAVAGYLAVSVWRLVGFPVAAVLRLLEPLVSSVGIAISVAGILVSVVLEFSGSAPRFPFWGSMALFVGCGLIPVIYRSVIRVLAR